jgi:hypothetical protein
MSYGIGIDLGGTRIKSARFELVGGRLLGSALAPTRDGEYIGTEPAFIANAWQHIEPGLGRWLDQYEWRPSGHRVPVVPAALGEWAGCYGAARLAMQALTFDSTSLLP